MKLTERSESIYQELAEKAVLLEQGKLKPEPRRKPVLLPCRDGVIRPRSFHKLPSFEEFCSKFWSQVKKSDGCWEWTGTKGYEPYAYGKITWKQCPLLCHRVSYVLKKGPIPKGMLVCHKCDNPKCVNPDHLFPGSSLDNLLDCIKKGRKNNVVGEDHCRAKLTVDQVKEIRAEYPVRTIKQVDFANKYGVSRAAIHHIVKGSSWKCLL